MRCIQTDIDKCRALEFCHPLGGILQRRRLGRCGDRPNEPIAPAVHRLNEPRLPGIVLQGMPQFANADLQDHVTHYGLRPDCLKQRFFGQQLARVLHKAPQDGKGFGPQGKRLCQTPQLLVGEIQTERRKKH
jgi:hypothetical protein